MNTKELSRKLSRPGVKATGISLLFERVIACKFSRPSWTRRQESKKKPSSLNNQSGQIILEYILLLFISVSIATFLTRQLINRNPDKPGIITGAWSAMNQAIGSDIVE
jgi:hypothetical protein